MIVSRHTVKCEKCSKNISVEGKNASRGELYKKSTAANWQWKSATVQFCPDHRTEKKPAGKKNTIKKVLKKASTSKPKKVSAPATPPSPEVAVG